MSREDGELDPGLERIVRILKNSPAERLPINFAEQVVSASVGQQPGRDSGRGLVQRFLNYVLQPRSSQMRPAFQFACVAALCLVSSALTFWAMNRPLPEDPAPQNVWVRFAVQAPDARQVMLAGDFNAWKADDIRLQDPEGDGVWHTVVPLHPGVYQYMFVLDGDEWIPDPQSTEMVDDGFGQRNSLMTVQPVETGVSDPKNQLNPI